MSNKQYYGQLDGLRAVAVMLVIISHFIIVPSYPGLLFLKFGFWGVNIFFVLSGFLITEILLNDIGTMSAGKLLKKFYIRRTLRIFPIYYLTLAALFMAGYLATDVMAYAVTYTYNIANFLNGTHSEIITHFWSLCVEEQFYLFFPALLLLINKRWHLSFLLIMVLTGIAIRAILLAQAPANKDDIIFFTPTGFDCLGGGALLAWLKINRNAQLQVWLKRYWIPVLSTLLFFAVAWMNRADIDNAGVFIIWARLLTAITGFYLVGIGAMNWNTIYGKLMHLSLFMKVGAISYGLYVYHWIIYVLIADTVTQWAQSYFTGFLMYNAYIVNFVVVLAITFIVTIVSYNFIEKPLLKLKNRFQ